MNRALQAYRIVAWVVGVLLIVLVCVGVPLKYAADSPEVSKYVGLVHGIFFYPLFLVVTLLLGIRTRMPMVRLLTAMVLGTVPFLSFWSERQTTRWVHEHQRVA